MQNKIKIPLEVKKFLGEFIEDGNASRGSVVIQDAIRTYLGVLKNNDDGSSLVISSAELETVSVSESQYLKGVLDELSKFTSSFSSEMVEISLEGVARAEILLLARYCKLNPDEEQLYQRISEALALYILLFNKKQEDMILCRLKDRKYLIPYIVF